MVYIDKTAQLSTSFKNNQIGNISRCHKYLDNIEQINMENVASLPKDIRDFITDISPKRLKELAKLNCFAAVKTKKSLDKMFGSNNYAIIALGRSLSSIVELIGHLGVETKNIPLSGLRSVSPADIGISEEDINVYKKFLSSIGLTKQELEKNKHKQYVLMDYTLYGRSLENAEKFLKEDNMLGKSINLMKLPIKSILGCDYENRGYDMIFRHSRFKDFSCVGRLPIKNIKNVFIQSKPDTAAEFRGQFCQGLRKLFWFNVFDSFLKNNYRNIMPKQELDKIYAYYRYLNLKL